MNQARLLQILIAPQRSEKAYRVADKHRQFVFKVLLDATKQEFKEAVEFLFEVKVDKVRVANVKGKRKNFGRILWQDVPTGKKLMWG